MPSVFMTANRKGAKCNVFTVTLPLLSFAHKKKKKKEKSAGFFRTGPFIQEAGDSKSILGKIYNCCNLSFREQQNLFREVRSCDLYFQNGALTSLKSPSFRQVEAFQLSDTHSCPSGAFERPGLVESK